MSFSTYHETAEPMAMNKAILLYGPRNGGSGYATVHPVVVGTDGAPTIRAGQALDRNALARIIYDLSLTVRQHRGLLPPEVLAVGDEHVMWWLPPGTRTFYFDAPTKEAGSIGKRAGKGFHPGLIFVAGKQSMWVYAVKGVERPCAETPVFHAPMMNVWDSGKVCTGTMRLPIEALTTSIAKWADAFFVSAFTHPNHPKAVSYKGGLNAFWRAMLDGAFAGFPEKVLVPIKGETAGSLVARMESQQQ